MDADHVALMVAVLGGSLVLAALLAWRGGDARRDVGLLGAAAASLLATSGLLLAA
jgi:hypothetical protein